MKRKIKRIIKRFAPQIKVVKTCIQTAARIVHKFHTYAILVYIIMLNSKINVMMTFLDSALNALGQIEVVTLQSTMSGLGTVAAQLDKLLQIFHATGA